MVTKSTKRVNNSDAIGRSDKLTTSSTLVAVMAALASLLLTLYTLFFLVRPSARPPENVGASITKVELQEGLTYQQWLDSQSDKTNSATNDTSGGTTPQPSEEGLMAFIGLDLKGLQKKDYTAWLEYVEVGPGALEVEPGAPVIGSPKSGKALRWYCRNFEPSVASDKGVIRCWVHNPEKAGSYYLRMELYETPKHRSDEWYNPRQSQMLDFFRTDIFTYKPEGL
jgi:hypothetical protein